MLINVPAADQRTEVGNDGRAPEDGNMDCVPESLACMARGLEPGLKVTGDGLHDTVYGQGYIGMQDPARFVDALRALGFMLAPVGGTAEERLAAAVAAIQAGHPVLLSIPSDWNDEPPTSQYAHMVAGCDTDGSSWLTAMNPWGGFYQRQSLAWWRERRDRCSYQDMWIMQKAGVASVWTMEHDPKTGNLTGAHDDQGHHVGSGFAWEIHQRGITADAYMNETYPTGFSFRSFCPIADGTVLVWDGGSQVGVDGARVAHELWAALLAAKNAPPPPPTPAPIPEAYVKAKAALDALVAAIGWLGGRRRQGWHATWIGTVTLPAESKSQSSPAQPATGPGSRRRRQTGPCHRFRGRSCRAARRRARSREQGRTTR
jgi:hypothetical protein